MSRFIFTNNKLKLNYGIKAFIKADLKPINNSTKYFQSFKRTNVKEDNIIEFNNGDFISVIGTLIYNNNIGKKSYESIYNSFDGDIQKIQKRCHGHYCIILNKNNKLSIFCDKYNIFKIYYYYVNDEFFISNSLDSVCRSLDKKVLRLFPLLEDSIQRGVINKEMFYKNVFRLFGNEKISIVNNDFVVEEFKHFKEFYDSSNKENNLSKIVDKLCLMLIKNAKLLRDVFKSDISIQSTGGMDSRIVTASFLNIDYKPKLLYGIGDSPITNTLVQDKDSVLQQAKLFDLEVNLMDWGSKGYDDESKIKHYFKKYGFNYATYHCAINHFIAYENKVSKFSKMSTNGLFGENFKVRGWAVNKKKNYLSLNEIIQDYHIPHQCIGFSWRSKNILSKYVKYLKKNLIDVSSIYQIPIKNNEHVKMDHFEELRQIFSRTMDSHEANLINEFIYYLSPLAMVNTYEFGMSIPWKYKHKQRLGVRVLKKLHPKILKIPIFSHTKNFNIINDSLELRSSNLELLKDKLRFLIPNFILDIRRNIIVNKLKNKKRDKIESYYINKLKNHNLIKDIFDIENYNGDVRPLIMLYLYLVGIDDIGYDSVTFE